MSTNKFKTGAVLLLFLLVNFSASAKDPLKFQWLSLEKGAELNLTYCMLQDHKGFIWFGTMYGLVKYDGKDFQIYKNNPDSSNSISFEDIISLYEDSGNNIWIRTQGGGLNKFNPEPGKYLDFRGKFENDKMILSRSTVDKKGEPILQRMVYYNLSKNDFDWNWEISRDNGKTWDLKWKIHYSRKR